jgi:hypothetical protein
MLTSNRCSAKIKIENMFEVNYDNIKQVQSNQYEKV